MSTILQKKFPGAAARSAAGTRASVAAASVRDARVFFRAKSKSRFSPGYNAIRSRASSRVHVVALASKRRVASSIG
jgi:hypothetical protein